MGKKQVKVDAVRLHLRARSSTYYDETKTDERRLTVTEGGRISEHAGMKEAVPLPKWTGMTIFLKTTKKKKERSCQCPMLPQRV